MPKINYILLIYKNLFSSPTYTSKLLLLNSLIEFLGAKTDIHNEFNRSILKENALFFHHQEDISRILSNMSTLSPTTKNRIIACNLKVTQNGYSWEKLINDYEAYFLRLLSENRL